MDHAGIGFLQIDAGRIGGVSVAKDAADYAAARGVTYVNHTFTSHLALSASLAPYAGLERDEICEYLVEPQALALAITGSQPLPGQPLPDHRLPGHPLPGRDRQGAGARKLNSPCLTPDADGLLRLPEGPGYGVTVDVESIRPYLVDCEIKVAGKVLYRTPELGNHT